jgi:hypothetical protein
MMTVDDTRTRKAVGFRDGRGGIKQVVGWGEEGIAVRNDA